MRVILSVSLPQEIAKSLEEYAKSLKVAKSDIVREALSQYLWGKRFDYLRKKVAPLAEKEGLLTDEDVFRKITS